MRFEHSLRSTGFDFKGASVLVSGCGLGGELIALRDMGATRVFGVEPDREAQDLAARATQTYRDIIVRDTVPVGHSFDFVLSRHVLEHVPSDGRVEYLESLRRALVPGGQIFLQVPNQDCPIEPYTGIEFFHGLSVEERSRALKYFRERADEGGYSAERVGLLESIREHRNIGLHELELLTSHMGPTRHEYSDSSMLGTSSSGDTLRFWVAAVDGRAFS